MKERKFDLAGRTLKFAKDILDFVGNLRKTTENLVLIRQLTRSATSVGANYLEANDADNRKDFIYKVKICRREAKESVYWLELTVHANPSFKDKVNWLVAEGKELTLIFSKSVRTALTHVK